jgi:hypothetical protein
MRLTSSEGTHYFRIVTYHYERPFDYTQNPPGTIRETAYELWHHCILGAFLLSPNVVSQVQSERARARRMLRDAPSTRDDTSSIDSTS